MVFEHTVYSQLYRHISPYISPTQFGFIKGTGAQDCGAAIAFTAMQTLEHRKESRVVSLNIRGAFDSVWWNGLLQHLWSVELRGRVYKLMCSYLSNRTLFVVAHGDTGHLQPAFFRVASDPLSVYMSPFSSNSPLWSVYVR